MSDEGNLQLNRNTNESEYPRTLRDNRLTNVKECDHTHLPLLEPALKPTIEELRTKLNITLIKYGKYAISSETEKGLTVREDDIVKLRQQGLLKDEKYEPQLCSIQFQRYQSTSEEEHKYATKSSAQLTEECKIKINSFKNALTRIITGSFLSKSSSESILIQIINADPDSVSRNMHRLRRKSSAPSLLIEIIRPSYSLENNHTLIAEKDKIIERKRPKLPSYLKLRKPSTDYILLRTIHPNFSHTEEEEEIELYRAVSESLVISNLSEHQNYIKFKIPYQILCRERLAQEKLTQEEQAHQEFALLETVQMSALAGVNIRRQYCQNTFKSTKTISLLLQSDQYKLQYLKNYMTKMMPTYAKHNVPEVNILTQSLPESVAEKRKKMRRWLDQFKS